MDKTVKIKYLKGWAIDPEDDIKVPVYGYQNIAQASYRRYYNTLCIVAGVGGAARNLLDYLCERMDGNNNIHSNKSLRDKFVKDVSDWTDGKLVYSDASIKKAIHTLVKKGLLIKTSHRGTLLVNPEYFFKSDERHRIHSIQMLLEFKDNDEK